MRSNSVQMSKSFSLVVFVPRFLEGRALARFLEDPLSTSLHRVFHFLNSSHAIVISLIQSSELKEWCIQLKNHDKFGQVILQNAHLSLGILRLEVTYDGVLAKPFIAFFV
jgi:hypothetical protein